MAIFYLSGPCAHRWPDLSGLQHYHKHCLWGCSGNSARATEVPAAATAAAKLTWHFSVAGAYPSGPLTHCTPTTTDEVSVTIIPVYR